jgi:hypothetical protein
MPHPVLATGKGVVMLQKLTTVLGSILLVGVLTGPAFAPSVPGMKHHVTGNVTAVNRGGRTVTVIDDKSQRSFNFEVKDSAMLTGINKGEHVRVAYSKHGPQLLASSIVPKPATTSRATSSK